MKKQPTTTHPILFTADMVRAILEGRKTQTRRIIKPQPRQDASGGWQYGKDYRNSCSAAASPATDVLFPYECPYGQPGHHLWVRETWLPAAWDAQEGMVKFMYKDQTKSKWIQPYQDDPDGEKFDKLWLSICDELARKGIKPGKDGMYNFQGIEQPLSWRPAIHMPRAASRIHLQITDIRAQRLHDITEADAIAEGIEENSGKYRHYNCPSKFAPLFDCEPIESYRTLWEKINGPHSWEQNPWVWAITFRVCPPSRGVRGVKPPETPPAAPPHTAPAQTDPATPPPAQTTAQSAYHADSAAARENPAQQC